MPLMQSGVYLPLIIMFVSSFENICSATFMLLPIIKLYGVFENMLASCIVSSILRLCPLERVLIEKFFLTRSFILILLYLSHISYKHLAKATSFSFTFLISFKKGICILVLSGI